MKAKLKTPALLRQGPRSSCHVKKRRRIQDRNRGNSEHFFVWRQLTQFDDFEIDGEYMTLITKEL